MLRFIIDHKTGNNWFKCQCGRRYTWKAAVAHPDRGFLEVRCDCDEYAHRKPSPCEDAPAADNTGPI